MIFAGLATASGWRSMTPARSSSDASNLSLATAAKAIRAARALFELIDDPEQGLNNGNKHKLGQSLHGLELKYGRSPVPAAHHQWPLVIRVYQPDQVAQHYPVLVTQTG